jgi:hypothetical protein
MAVKKPYTSKSAIATLKIRLIASPPQARGKMTRKDGTPY